MIKLNYALLLVAMAIVVRVHQEMGPSGLLGVVGLSPPAVISNVLSSFTALQSNAPDALVVSNNILPPSEQSTTADQSVSADAVSVSDTTVLPVHFALSSEVPLTGLSRESRSIHRRDSRTHRKLPPSYPIYDPPPAPSPSGN